MAVRSLGSRLEFIGSFFFVNLALVKTVLYYKFTVTLILCVYIGLTTGAALHVISSQMKSMTGVTGVPVSSEAQPWGLAQVLYLNLNN